ncbi:hypothetical protein GCM10011342_20600 [Aquisalinus flavus]|uniref:DUF4267 domain-containing protein n=1 Tax=Aquisalinus flavus TaxID=1526572 RepID=A0A8J2Y5C8_9PROT|nr:hypothetical protein GCM10011342_20600 [Aquisalinus flavus]
MRVGVWSSLVSSIMLIGIGAFWIFFHGAAEGAFSIPTTTPEAAKYARITAIFKAIGDILPAVFVLIALYKYQFRLAGYFHLVTLVLVILVDMLTWSAFVPDPSLRHILMHVPFAIPMIIAAICFLGLHKPDDDI